ncbi:MAG: hypothetical protein FWH32_08575 [Clostridiales bacterium]|nr:hypothetical protein [Clostridiales bacterium]
MERIVINKLKIEADEVLLNEILDTIKSDKYGRGTIDFNKIIPMPTSYLSAKSSNRSARGIEIYESMKKSGIVYHGDERYEFSSSISVAVAFNEFFRKYEWAIKNDPEIIEFGKACFENKEQFGFPTWDEWCLEEWGNELNAIAHESHPYEAGSGLVTFVTSFSGAPRVVERIAEMFPSATFNYNFADEDIGYNLAEMTFRDGKFDSGFTYGSYCKEAIEFAAGLWGIPISGPNAEYLLSHDGSGYLCLDDYRHNVINLLG